MLDDASTDATPTLRERYPEFSWRRHEHPTGYLESRNELMRSAVHDDYFLCLDDDAWFLDGDELSLALAYLEANPGVAGVAFDIRSHLRPDRKPRGAPLTVGMFIGCGHLLRLSAVRAVGYYAPTPGAYGSEEKDLCLRLADLDYSIVRLPGVHVWHEKAWGDRDNRPLHRSGACNELVMTLRRCPLPDLLLVLPWKISRYVWFWMKNPFYLRAGLLALADFIRHLRASWRSRQPVRRSTFWSFHRRAL